MLRARIAGLAASALAGLTSAVLASAAQACGPRAEVRFSDGAPDSFEILNRSPAGWQILEVALDLRGSVGGVYFDPTGEGAGASMPDPFRPRGGGAHLVDATRIDDGDTAMALRFEGFGAGASYVFTADVDDHAGDPPHAMVDPGEIAGAAVRVRFSDGGHEVEAGGRFNGTAVARTEDRAACS